MDWIDDPAAWREIELRLVADSLQRRVGVRTDTVPGGWKVAPGHHALTIRLKQRWPDVLVNQARDGDELHWYRSPQETWDHLCGREGWALARAGAVIDFTIETMN